MDSSYSVVELLTSLGGAIVGGAAVYAGIRADLAELKARVQSAESGVASAVNAALRAHDRIDHLLRDRHARPSTIGH
jgi:hypothetical protein